MKIAIVTNSSWSAYNFRSNLARAFIKDGHDVIFIIPFDNDYSEKLKKSFKCHNLSIDSKSINPLKDLKTFFNLLRVYSQVKPDIICHFTIKLNIYGTKKTFENHIDFAKIFTHRDKNTFYKLNEKYKPLNKGLLLDEFLKSIISNKNRNKYIKEVFDCLSVCFAIDTSIKNNKTIKIKYFK